MSFSNRSDSVTWVLTRVIFPLFLLALHRSNGAQAQGANFWLSIEENGPTAPTLYVAPNSLQTIDIWGSPQAGNLLNAISLNLVAEQPGVLSFQELTVHNPEIQEGLFRHQLVFDSATGLNLQANLIEGFLGLSFFEGDTELPPGIGIGPTCDPEDLLFCSDQPGGPAWLFASVTLQMSATVGAATDLYLEISLQGVAHNNGSPAGTQVVFGLPEDAPNSWDVEAEAGENHVGLPDARVMVASADFDEDGDVDGLDFLIWQQGLGVGSMLSEGDANGDNLVDAADLSIWEAQWGASANSVTVIVEVPEPATYLLLQAVCCSIWLKLRPLKKRFIRNLSG